MPKAVEDHQFYEARNCAFVEGGWKCFGSIVSVDDLSTDSRIARVERHMESHTPQYASD
jgi:hypothetical protein